MKKFLPLIVFLFTFIAKIQCVIIGADVWCKNVNGQKQYIYSLKDVHLYRNTEQIEDIVEIAKKLGSSNLLLLTEINEDIEEMYKGFNCEIMALHDAFKIHNLLVRGVDKRLILGYENILIYETKLKGLINHYDIICEKILSYNDTNYLNQLYKDFSNSIKVKFRILLEKIKDLEQPVIFVKVAMMFSLFNEIEILHQIYINPSKKHIFLYFGNTHINNINPHLVNLGYKKLYSDGYNIKVLDYDKDRNLISHSNNLSVDNAIVEGAGSMELCFDQGKIKSLNMKHFFDDLNNRFNIFNSSNQIVSKL